MTVRICDGGIGISIRQIPCASLTVDNIIRPSHYVEVTHFVDEGASL